MTLGVSVVIPSIKDDVLTVESVPERISVSIEREGSLNEARNRGVRKADSEIVAIFDDDIAFSEDLFETLVDSVDENTLLGVGDWEFGLVAGRVMIFYKSLWENIGGFDERLRSHNGDTDFALRAHDAGYSVKTIPRDLFYHEDHERSITTWDRAWRLAYICGKHLRYAPYILSSILSHNLGLKAGVSKEQHIPEKIRDMISRPGQKR